MKNLKRYTLILITAMLLVFSIMEINIISFAARTTSTGTTLDGFSYEIIDDATAIITGYDGEDSHIVIPSVIDGKPVTEIGNWAFEYCWDLTSVIIPDSVINIGDDAFYNCKNLTNILIPNSVISIGDHAFRECENLTNILIPNSVTSIGYCTFWGCENLTTIMVDSSNQNFSSQDGVLFNKEKTELICFPSGKNGIYNIPSSVDCIKQSAFLFCDKLTNIFIPSSVTNIKEDEFSQLLRLSNIYYAGSKNDFNNDWAKINVEGNYGKFVIHYNSVLPSQITLDTSDIELFVGDTYNLSSDVCFKPVANTTVKALEWTSSDPDTAFVSNGGNISAKAPGTAIITAETINGITVSCRVNIKEVTTDYGISNPKTINGVTTWDCVWFGDYWQDDTNNDGKADKNDTKKPIKWKVLSVKGNDAFLISDKNLDCQSYNATDITTDSSWITWERCTLRNWLNTTFNQNAFSSNEKEAINTVTVLNDSWYGIEGFLWAGNDTDDKIYVLSITEQSNEAYGFVSDLSTFTENTAYVENCAADHPHYFTGPYNPRNWWWLRDSAGHHASLSIDDTPGDLAQSPINQGYSVRPCLHLKLSSSTWSKAGTVNSLGEVNEISPEINEPENPPTTGQQTTTQNPSTTEQQTTTDQTTTEKQTSTEQPTDNSSTTAVKAPSQVKKVTGKNNKKKSATLSWKKVSGAKGYQIQYSTSNKFKSAKSKTTSKTKATITKLKKKKTYYFRIRAYKLNGKTKVYGKWSNSVKLKIKK